MRSWLRIGGWAVLGLVLLWVVFEIVRLVLGFISWLISVTVSLLVAALLLYLAYRVVMYFIGDRDRPQSTSRERIYE